MKNISFLLLFILFISSCKKDKNTDPTPNPTSPIGTYSLISANSDLALDVDSDGVFNTTNVMQKTGLTSTIKIDFSNSTISGDLVGVSFGSSFGGGNDPKSYLKFTKDVLNDYPVTISGSFVLAGIYQYTLSSDRNELSYQFLVDTFVPDTIGGMEPSTATLTLTYRKQ